MTQAYCAETKFCQFVSDKCMLDFIRESKEILHFYSLYHKLSKFIKFQGILHETDDYLKIELQKISLAKIRFFLFV